MKIRSTTLKALIGTTLLSAGTLYGQTTYIWTGTADGTNIATAGNWSPNGQPNGTTQDTAEWNGTAAGNLIIDNEATGLPGTGFGTSGINLDFESPQSGSVQIISSVASSANFAINSITVNSGTFILGDGTANILQGVDRPAGAIHNWINNSSSTAVVGASVRWVAGGGNANEIDFQGTGNWAVTNYLRDDNGAGPRTIESDSSGTITWVADPVQRGNSPTGPIIFNTGTIVLKSPGLMPFENPGTVPVGNNTIANNALVIYDAGVGSTADNQQRVISGSGNIQVKSGTLQLSGQNTYTGSNILSGGELVANAPETPGTSSPLGMGTNTFAGGTLGFSANNTYDYSSRFDPSPNQAYSIDTAGQDVTFSNGLASSGGTLAKLGSGTLTLLGTSSYNGLTTVSAGRLVFEGSKTGSAGITVQDSAALGVYTTGTQVTPGTLTLGSSSGATLEFNNLSSTTTAPIAAGTLSSAGTITININSGTLSPGSSYPLLTWTGGAVPLVNLGLLNGFIGNLSFSGNELILNITATAFKWTGLASGSWDLTTANNWVQNGGPVVFANGGPALMDDTATGATNITVGALVQPTLLTVNNNSLMYSIASSGGNNIGGAANLLKAGTSTLTLSGGANSYTGVTTVSGGTLSVSALANGGSASDIGAAANTAGNLVLNGGTLQYTNGGAANIDRLFTVGTSGGTIDGSGNGGLDLNNTGSIGLSGSGARTLILTGSESNDLDVLAGVLGDNVGSSSLVMNGVGTWDLTGNNTYSGSTTINSGILEVGNGGSTGTIGTGSVVDNGALVFNRTGTVTINSVISGSGAVSNNSTGTLILANNNTYQGNTFNNGTGTLQIGNGGSTGSTEINGAITNNGTLTFNSTGSYTLNGNIGGTGQVIKQGSGLLILQGTEANNGLTIASGGQLEIFKGNQGVYGATGGITNNGNLFFVRQDNAVAIITNPISGTGTIIKDVNNAQGGDVTFVGTNTYTGPTLIAGGGIVLGDGVTAGAGAIIPTNNVIFTNSVLTANDTLRQLVFQRPDNFTFSNNIVGATKAGVAVANSGEVFQNGSGTVTLVGNNTYNGGTIVSNGTLVVAGPTPSIGTNTVTIGSTLVLSNTTAMTIPGVIAGGSSGTLIQAGSGTTTLTGNNTNIVIEQTTLLPTFAISNGTLVATSAGGDVDVAGGALGAGGLGTAGTLTVAGGNLNISAGSVVATLNTSAAQSNSYVLMTANETIDTNQTPAVTNIIGPGGITNTGGSLVLTNVGPTLAVGDRFVIFSEPVVGGASMSVTLPGYTFINHLATDGSITVSTAPVSVSPKFKSITLSGGNVIITATNNSGPGGTYHLYGTNNIKAPVATWPLISTGSFGSDGNVSITNAAGTGAEFYIMQVP